MSAETSPTPRPQSAATVARNRRKSLASAIAVVIIVLICGAVWLVAHRSGASSTAKTATASTSTSKNAAGKPSSTKTTGKTTAASGVPARVTATLALIDAGRWPDAANAPGTQGGRSFRNGEGLLPRTDASGKNMRYQEWDVNAKRPGRGRDAERIITAADGSAWYTLDHYRTFIKIRGPNS
ncbi:ribonuclease N [Gordonia sp. TBRC 11910]|uniref:Ribonuclease N n=1 Tax=Gordonia asplenii TaxID=2725283 RepID=A0A848L118_9ACTN|nr:ribonuclease domain-containing protein [Gordonia asplenii]NMO04162.1 ribonuclease N [Gordonia asplenii]